MAQMKAAQARRNRELVQMAEQSDDVKKLRFQINNAKLN